MGVNDFVRSRVLVFTIREHYKCISFLCIPTISNQIQLWAPSLIPHATRRCAARTIDAVSSPHTANHLINNKILCSCAQLFFLTAFTLSSSRSLSLSLLRHLPTPSPPLSYSPSLCLSPAHY